jgi:hypothetical protein
MFPIGHCDDALLLGASSVFSWFGLLYVGTPIAVLLISAKCFSTDTCRAFWLLVAGCVVAIAALVLVIALVENRARGLTDDQLAWLANGAVCLGVVVGVVGFRIAHGVVRRFASADSRVK